MFDEGSIKRQEVALCAASAYEKKFYLNPLFAGCPQRIKEELKIMCVLFTEDVGGILELVFDTNGELEFRTSADEADYLYDEIGSALKVKELQRTKQELFESLRLFYQVIVLGEVEEG